MSTLVLERPAPVLTDVDDDSIHLLCCDPNVALCGKDVTEEPFVEESPDEKICVGCEMREALGPGCPACEGRSS